MVGGNMSNVNAWDDIICKLKSRLSKWKLKTLSIGGRLTLLKSVLGSTRIFWMSLYKVPKSVLSSMEAIRRNFLTGLKATKRRLHGLNGPSGMLTRFWNDVWIGDQQPRYLFSRIYALDEDKDCSVAAKLQGVVDLSLRRHVYLDRLPTRLNLLHRGVHVPSLSCPICSSALEDTSHLLFSCGMASDVVRLVCRWNHLLFEAQKPRKDVIFDDIVVLIMEYLVKIGKKARILELKQRYFEDYCSEIQYAISIKEDTAYLCLNLTKDHEGTSSIRHIQKNSIRRIEDIKCEYSGRYQTWSLLQETLDMPYQTHSIRRLRKKSRLSLKNDMPPRDK
nr:RNA-directed DNA polymerase, eukaryota [Tanacetum cinerariifolium]